MLEGANVDYPRAPRLDKTTLRSGDSLHVAVDVTNTGAVAGDEVVQLYVRDDVASVTRPVKELRGFRRVSVQPGQMTTVRFVLSDQDLAFYDATMRCVIEPGRFTVFAGSSSDAVREARFDLVTPSARPVRISEACRSR